MKQNRESKLKHSFPMFLSLSGRLCVVVGAGSVGKRRVASLLKAAATVRVVAPDAECFAQEVEVLQKHFEPSDLDGAFLVVAATNSVELNRRIVAEARVRGALVNCGDSADESDFVVPALAQVGDEISVAITTHGDSAALAALLKEKVMTALDPEWSEVARVLGEVREECHGLAKMRGVDSAGRSALWQKVMTLPLLELAKSKNTDEIIRRAIEIFSGK